MKRNHIYRRGRWRFGGRDELPLFGLLLQLLRLSEKRVNVVVVVDVRGGGVLEVKILRNVSFKTNKERGNKKRN